MAKTYISIDLDKLASAISSYDDIISEFEDALKSTEKAINSLKTCGWKSNASSAYFMTYDDAWKKNMNKRLKIIKHLRDCLMKAQTEYTAVYEEMENLDKPL